MNAKEHARFEEKIIPDPNSGCWIWSAATTRDGYGMLRISRTNKLAHRLSYEHFVGQIQTGLELDHICRVRACANPLHLEPVTHRENHMRMLPYQLQKTHCSKGHAYTAENTLRCAGKRICRKCKRLRDVRNTRKYREEKAGGKISRKIRLLTFNEKTQCIRAWENELGLGVGTVWRRLSKGLSIEESLTKMTYAGRR